MQTSERKSRGGLTGLLLLLFFAKKTIHIMRETTGLYQWASCPVSLFYFSTNKKKEKERKRMERRYTVKECILGEYKPAILVENRDRGEYMWRSECDESFCFGPAADKLYAYEELGYSPEELKKMIARLKDLEKTPVTQPASDISSITSTNLPSYKPNPITWVRNMNQMEQYFTDRNIKVIRKWDKVGTNTRYTFTLTYAGVTQDYHFTYPDAVNYAERNKKMTEFCEGAYSCFDKYVRDRVRVTYMPARQNGKSLIEKVNALYYADTDVAITQKIFDLSHVNANRTSLKELSKKERKKMNKNFTKADLKVGYVVKMRDGSLGMVLMSGTYGNKDPKLISVGASGDWTDIAKDINDNLCRKDTERDYDIVEVYGYSLYANCARDVSTDDRELLWKREEAKKMTVSEIEKILGYKVEVVAEEVK